MGSVSWLGFPFAFTHMRVLKHDRPAFFLPIPGIRLAPGLKTLRRVLKLDV